MIVLLLRTDLATEKKQKIEIRRRERKKKGGVTQVRR